MKILKLSILSAFFACCLSACSGDNVETYIIASKREMCMRMDMLAPCYKIKKADSDEWGRITTIEGFDYVEGYEYVVKIKVEKIENPPADAPNVIYTLVKVVSMTEK